MSHGFINLRPYSKSPSQMDVSQKFQTQPSKSPQIQFLQYLEQKTTTPFTTSDSGLKESNKQIIRLPQRQSYVKCNQTFDHKNENENFKNLMSQEPPKKNLRSISGQWQQFQSQEDKPESLLIKENETLRFFYCVMCKRNLVTNLQKQLKMVRQQNSQRNEITGIQIVEVDEDTELSSRVYVEQVEKLTKQIQSEREKFHGIIKDLERQLTNQEELNPVLRENDKLNEMIESQVKESEQAKKVLNDLREVHKSSSDTYLQQIEDMNMLKISQEQMLMDAQSYIQELEQKSEDILQQNADITQLCQELQLEVNHNKETQRVGVQVQSHKLQAEVQSHNERTQLLEEQFYKQRIRCLESEQQRDKSKREIAHLVEQIETLRRNNETLKREKDKSIHENEQLITFNQKRKDEFDLLFSDLEGVQNELISQTHLHNKLQQEKYIIEDQFRRQQADSQITLDGKKNTSQRSHQKLIDS